MSDTIQFGVLMHPYQALDCIGPLDILSSSQKSYLEVLIPFAPYDASVSDKGLKIKFHYIKENLEPSEHTAELRFVPTTTYDTCPKLDYILVGGPDPNWIKDPAFPAWAQFLKSRVPEVKSVFATCTGALLLGAAGVLDGHKATLNHPLIPAARQMAPKVQWTDERQWIVDGKFWTAGGACAGMDMFAAWVVEQCGRDVAESGWLWLDYEPRDAEGVLVRRERFGLRRGKEVVNGA